jgi:glycerol-3-phosphate acyltransferase PlsY
VRALALLYAVNTVLAAVLYVDVRRRGRSGWWLIAFWVLMYPVLVAYLVTGRHSANRSRLVA